MCEAVIEFLMFEKGLYMSEEPILRLNHQSGKYEGYLLIQVEPELFRRVLLKTVEEDETADLTDPAIWTVAIKRVSKITKWLDHSHTVIKSVTNPIVASVPAPEPRIKKEEPKSFLSKIHNRETEAILREKAKKLPPYQWFDALMTPLPDGLPANSPEKQRVYYARSDERKILNLLFEEWQSGFFSLEANADILEKEYQEQEARKSIVKIEAIANAVNGNHLR